MADQRVLQVQQWLNETYKNDDRYNEITEDGLTGWSTIYALRRALQIELGIQETSNSFGPQTYEKCPTITQGEEGNLVYIVQGGLWCKGYNPGGFTGYYGNGTYNAVKQLKADAGFPTASGNMQKDFMKALLDMSAFTCLTDGTEEIREIQQKLNYDYYDYYQICPCDGLYNRDMNKMLIYALQKELGISKSAATGTWGPTTTSLCKEKVYSIGNSSNIIKLIRYATVCNGYSVSTSSSTYDSTLDNILESFCDGLKITKPTNKVNYTVIKSLLSSNGDTDRSALGCDTATKLTSAQIQTIKNAGYKYVGRYITNTPGGTLDKCLTRSEVENILNSNLKLFAIFQESGNSASSFTPSKALTNGQRAYEAAENLGIPHGSTIYFAVDFDPTDAIISSNIIPYFAGLILTNAARKYRIGVYGTRNVCNRLKNQLGLDRFFVSDASYGFSGNLGFNIPSNWSFDQFATDITIGSGNNQVSIDKVAVSGRDNAISYIKTNVTNVILDFLKPFDLDDKLDISLNYEEDVPLQFLKPSTNTDGNFIALSVQRGITIGSGNGISFNNENELVTEVESYLNQSIFDNVSSSLKASIKDSVYDIGFSVQSGNLEVGIATISDRDNSGIMVIFELTVPTTSDESTYIKITLEFKFRGNITFDFSNLNIETSDLMYIAGMYIAFGILMVSGPTAIPALATAFGVSNATNMPAVANITESFRLAFED